MAANSRAEARPQDGAQHGGTDRALVRRIGLAADLRLGILLAGILILQKDPASGVFKVTQVIFG